MKRLLNFIDPYLWNKILIKAIERMVFMKKLNYLIKFSRAPIKYYLILIVSVLYVAAFNIIFSFFIQQGIALANRSNTTETYLYYAILFITSCIIFSISNYTSGVVQEKIIQYSSMNLKKKMLSKIMKIPLSESQKYSSGDLLTRINDDCNNVCVFTCKSVVPIVQLCLTIILGLAYVFYASWIIGIIICTFLPFFYFFNFYYSKKMEEVNYELFKIDGKQRTFFEQFHDNGSIVKFFSLHERLKNRNEQMATIKLNLVNKNVRYLGIMVATTETSVLLVELFVLLIGILLLNKGLISLMILIGAWNAAIGSIVYPITELPNILSTISLQKTSLNRIIEILNFEQSSDIAEDNNIKPNDKIVIKDICFKYPATSNNILSNLSFELKKGNITYLIGESGSGKSTLMKILSGFYLPNQGTISVKLKDSYSPDYYKYITYVPPNNSLFQLSILDNIRLGNVNISFKEIIPLATQLGIHEFVEKLPNKYDTVLDATLNLSEGQMQRIAILRGLLMGTDYLILDEPFASLDAKNIQLLLGVLKSYATTKGILIVSHHTDLLQSDSLIFRLKGGMLYEEKKCSI